MATGHPTAQIAAPAARNGTGSRDTSVPAREGDALFRDIFRCFPYGILVVDATGAVVLSNPEAERLLGGRIRPGSTCCTLLGCRDESGPLDGACLTELALERGSRLAEVRIDLPGTERAAWVTAAPLDAEPTRVLVELRPGHRKDRRRESDVRAAVGPRLRLSLLGRTRVEGPDGPIEGEWLSQRPGELLKYLAWRRRVVPVDEVASALWPGADQRAVGRVRYLVHELRDRLEPGRAKHVPSPYVLAVHGGYRLDEDRVQLDTHDFEAAVGGGVSAFARGDPGAAAAALAIALDLYQGDFLAEDPYLEWAIEERDRMRDLASRGLRILSEIRMAEGDLERAHRHLERLATLEPFDQGVQRMLIETCLRRGLRSQAARRYSTLRLRWLRDFGEELDFSFTELLGGEGGQLSFM